MKRWKLVITGEGEDRPLEEELQHEYHTADEAAKEAENLADHLFEETDEGWAVVPIETELTEQQRQVLQDAATEQLVIDLEQDRKYLRDICYGVVEQMSVDEQVGILSDDTERLIEILGFDPDNPQPWGKDQYGDVVPYDLVVVVWNPEMARDETRDIDSADWYEAEGRPNAVMISADAIRQVVDTWENKGLTRAFNDPRDCGIRPGTPIGKVAGILHRWNHRDGFYHA